MIAHTKNQRKMNSNCNSHQVITSGRNRFQNLTPVWADITKMCRIKFQGESLSILFLIWNHSVPMNVYLVVIDSVEPVGNVTVKRRSILYVWTCVSQLHFWSVVLLILYELRTLYELYHSDLFSARTSLGTDSLNLKRLSQSDRGNFELSPCPHWNITSRKASI